MKHQALIDFIDLEEKWQGKPRFTFYDEDKGLEVTDRKTEKKYFIRGYNYWELQLEKRGIIGPLKTSKVVARGGARRVTEARTLRSKQASRARLTR